MNIAGTNVDGGLLIVGGVVGGVVLSIAAYYIIRFMRGSIKLSLPKTIFNPGDTISGSFELQTKKDLEGNKLLISLIGVEITKSYHNGKQRTHTHEIYRDSVIVEEARPYPAGYLANYTFSIQAPDQQAPASELLNSTIGKTLTAAFQLLGNRSSQLKWKIEARLDAKGVDLATSKAISINSKQIF
jgi:hypothetical protein